MEPLIFTAYFTISYDSSSEPIGQILITALSGLGHDSFDHTFDIAVMHVHGEKPSKSPSLITKQLRIWYTVLRTEGLSNFLRS